MVHRKYLEKDIYIQRVIETMVESGEFDMGVEQIRFILSNLLRYVEVEYDKLKSTINSLDPNESTPEEMEEKMTNALKAFGEIQLPNLGKFVLHDKHLTDTAQLLGIPVVYNIYQTGSGISRMKRKKLDESGVDEYKGLRVVRIGGPVKLSEEERVSNRKAHDKRRNAGSGHLKAATMADAKTLIPETKSTYPLLNGSNAGIITRKKD